MLQNQAVPAAIWAAVLFSGQLVWLAAWVVPWHTFNFAGFGPFNFQACCSKRQGSQCQAETLSLQHGCMTFRARP
jgi:hypothetical protein